MNIMKNFKFIYLILAAVGAMAFTACNERDWAPGEADTNLGVYFAANTDVVVTADDTSASILVKRFNNISTDAVVAIVAEDLSESGFFTLPSEIYFASGEESANYVIEFDGSELTPGEAYEVRLEIDPREASNYGLSNAVFNVGIAEPWNALGTGIYRDDFMGPLYGGPSGITVPAQVVQHGLDPTRIRIVEPFSQANVPYIIGGVPSDMTFTTPGYVEFIIDPAAGTAYIPSSWLGFKLDVGTGNGPEDFYLASVYADETTPVYGKYEVAKGMISFPQPNSIMWHIPDGRGNYANTAGLLALVLPGFTLDDYSISAAYAGMVTESDNQTTTAIINFTVGESVTDYKFAVLEGAVLDATETVNGIIEGTLGEDVATFEAPADELSWRFTLDVGIYTIVAVPYGPEGAVADEASTTRFYYAGNGAVIPEAEVTVKFDALKAFTDNEEVLTKNPEEYYAALYLAGDVTEIMSIKVWMGDTAVVEDSGLEPEVIVTSYGSDFTPILANMVETGYVLAGPYNFMSGYSATAIVGVTTVYGKTQVYRVDHEMPYSGPLALGKYLFAEGEGDKAYKLDVTLTGGYADDTCFLHMSGFDGTAFYGVVDAEKKTLTFNGLFDGQEEPLFGVLYDYYDQAGSQAYGYYSSKTESFETVDDMVINLDDNFAPTSLATHFGCFVFALADGQQVGSLFYFSPAASITAVAEEETSAAPEEETPAAPAAAKFASSVRNSEIMTLDLGVRYVDVKAEKYEGALPSRELKHDAKVR